MWRTNIGAEISGRLKNSTGPLIPADVLGRSDVWKNGLQWGGTMGRGVEGVAADVNKNYGALGAQIRTK